MTRPILVVLSPRVEWPEPLQTLLARGDLSVRRVRSCHEAAMVAAAGDRALMGILIDADWLSMRELDMMNVIQRHTALPIWTLPASIHPKPVTEMGILPWEAAVQVFGRLLQKDPTPEVGKSNNYFAESAQTPQKTTDNPASKLPEISLRTDIAARYDGQQSPVLSRSEIAALLGTSE